MFNRNEFYLPNVDYCKKNFYSLEFEFNLFCCDYEVLLIEYKIKFPLTENKNKFDEIIFKKVDIFSVVCKIMSLITWRI